MFNGVLGFLHSIYQGNVNNVHKLVNGSHTPSPPQNIPNMSVQSLPPRPAPPAPAAPGGTANIPWNQYFHTNQPIGIVTNGSNVPFGLATPSYNPYLGMANFRALPLQPSQLPYLDPISTARRHY